MDGLTDQQRHDLVQACEILITNVTHQRLARRAAGQTPAGGALCRMCEFDACGRAIGNCPAARTVAVTPVDSRLDG
jgi:hypothetical protein